MMMGRTMAVTIDRIASDRCISVLRSDTAFVNEVSIVEMALLRDSTFWLSSPTLFWRKSEGFQAFS